MTQDCTESERWLDQEPASDASDEELDLFFKHVEACSYHALYVGALEAELNELVRLARRTGLNKKNNPQLS